MEKVKYMKRIDFENGTITNNILNAAIPMLVAQILSLLYNIVDRVYIARIPDVGTNALGAVGLCFPIIMIMTAFSNLFGSGGAPLFSIKRGMGDAPPVPYIIFLYILIDVKEIRDNYKVQISGKCIQAEYYSCRYKYHLTRIANSHKAYKCQIPYHSWKRKCVVIKKSLYTYIAEYILYLKGLVHKHLGYFKASSLPSLSLCVQFVHILYWVNKEYRIFAHFDSFILPVFHLECDMCILTYCICVIHPRL